jgi:basic membrane lipoprotein Med (substrate-binding protein (PBP1-ABC) superfamily)
MTKQNKNRKGQATPEEMVQSGSQLILKHDGETEQSIEEIAQDDPTTKEFHYKSWWNQFRGPGCSQRR